MKTKIQKKKQRQIIEVLRSLFSYYHVRTQETVYKNDDEDEYQKSVCTSLTDPLLNILNRNLNK